MAKWAAFIPHGTAGGDCFKELTINATDGTLYNKTEKMDMNASYEGRLIMTLDSSRPMPRLINALLDGFSGAQEIEPGFPLDIVDMKTPGVLRARDVHPYASIETLQDVRAGIYNYIIVKRGEAEWLALRERYPTIAQSCSSDNVQKVTVYKQRSKACCGGSSAVSGTSQDEPNWAVATLHVCRLTARRIANVTLKCLSSSLMMKCVRMQ